MRMRYDIFYFMINKDVEFFDEVKTGDVLSRIGADTTEIERGLSTTIMILVQSGLIIIMNILVLVLISWKLTLLTLAAIVPVIIVS